MIGREATDTSCMSNTNHSNAAIDSVHNFVGFDGTRYVTTWHDTKAQADAAVAAHVAAGASFSKRLPGSVLGEYRVVGHYAAQ